MAATGKTPILLYGSTTATNQPSAGNLTNSSDGCEIAINVADKNLFFKDATNTVNTVPIRQSSASSNGWLSSTDWSTFNSKQPAGTYVTSVTGTAPVVSSGGTTPAISMAAATGSVNGYLTSTDWTTFNSKQTALVSGTNIKTVSGTSLLGSGDVGTIGTGYGGTGLTSFTSGGLVYASSTSALATGSNVIWNGTNFLLGTGTVINYGGDASVVRQQTVLTSGNTNIVNTVSSFVSKSSGTPAAGVGCKLDLCADNAYSSVSPYGSIVSVATDLGNISGDLYFNTMLNNATVEQVRIKSTGDVQVKTGNVVISTSGKGIDFSATAGTGTSELLADYEEGTWTPSVGGTATYTARSGTYRKIGNIVTINCDITINAIGTGSTTNVSGFPYASNASGNFNVGEMGYWSSINSNVYWIGVINYPGASDAYFETTTSAMSTPNDNAAIITSGTRLVWSMTYQTA